MDIGLNSKFKSIKVKVEIYNWLKSLDPSVSKALANLKNGIIKPKNIEIKLKNIEEDISEIQELLEKVITFNKLRH